MKVRFIGADDDQVSFAGGADPRKCLKLNQEYELLRKEVHSWHTRYILKDFPNVWFNSVCFEESGIKMTEEERQLAEAYFADSMELVKERVCRIMLERIKKFQDQEEKMNKEIRNTLIKERKRVLKVNNWVVVLQRVDDPDDGMCSLYTGCINGFGKKMIECVSETRLVENHIDGFLRKSAGKDFGSREEILRAFLGYLENITLE